MNIQPGERVDFVFAVPADKLAQRGCIGLEIEGRCKCGGNLVRGRKPSTFMCQNSHWYNRKGHDIPGGDGTGPGADRIKGNSHRAEVSRPDREFV